MAPTWEGTAMTARGFFVALFASVAFGARFASAATIVVPAVEITSLAVSSVAG